MKSETFVYFIQNDEAGPIKIGYAKSVAARLSDLQCATPYPLYLLGYIRGSRHTEVSLHDKFAAFRLCGEWFKPEPELTKYIADVCAEPKKMSARETIKALIKNVDPDEVWRSLEVPTDKDAGKIIGISASALYRVYGPSGRKKMFATRARKMGADGGKAKGRTAKARREIEFNEIQIREIVSDPYLSWKQRLEVLGPSFSESSLRRHYRK